MLVVRCLPRSKGNMLIEDRLTRGIRDELLPRVAMRGVAFEPRTARILLDVSRTEQEAK